MMESNPIVVSKLTKCTVIKTLDPEVRILHSNWVWLVDSRGLMFLRRC